VGRGRQMRKSNRDGEFDKSAFYACMEIEQLNSFVQLTHAIKKIKKIQSYLARKKKEIQSVVFSMYRALL
jgi:hypothetical protein